MQIREPVVAGQFYPGDSETLKHKIQSFLKEVKSPKVKGKIYGIIVPHAGYDFSGQTAAYAFKQIESTEYDTVIILGPSHQVAFKGAAVYPIGYWHTPLGDVGIDSDFAKQLISQSKYITGETAPHKLEHSLEVELPWLQMVLKNFKIVPICIGDQSFEFCQVLADAIVGAINELPLQKVLLVASSDFYHGYSYEECKQSLSNSCFLISQYNYEKFYQIFREEGSACGGGCIVTLMLALKELGARQISLLYSTNSQDVAGTSGYVVGYASFVITNPGGLSNEEKDLLLEFARNSIISNVIEKPSKSIKPPESKKLNEKRGCFVTIKEHSKLRGCVGYVLPVKPLYQAIREMAVESALHDPRFSPVNQDELPELKIEISVLSELQRTRSIDEIQIGRDGLYIKHGAQSGLLLPQVAVEEKWDKLKFLEQTCWKAGLPKDAWQKAEIYRFQAEIFGDEI